MPKMLLTSKFIKGAKPPKTGQLDWFDTAIPAFGLRVTGGRNGGRKTFFLIRRFDGKRKRITLGHFPDLTLAEARAAAGELKELEVDPTEQEVVDATDRIPTFAEFAARYIKLDLPQHVTGLKNQRVIERELLPYWKNKPIDEITLKDANRRVDALMLRGTPDAAGRVVEIIKRLFSYAVQKGELTASPMMALTRPVKKVARDRVLKNHEIAALWPTWDELGWPFGTLFQLLLVTACRRDETAGMKWDEIDGETWTIPSERTKSDRVHLVHLSPLARHVLSQCPRTESPFVFAAPRGSTGYVTGYSAPKRMSDERSGIADWRLHDLRRSAASRMARLKVRRM